tara:strand:- start:9 stop:191 length:183 start_codon:yes stop_codon:yes gene_type:complete
MIDKFRDRLQDSVNSAIKDKEDMDYCSWNYQEGVLLTPNEAKFVIQLIKSFKINTDKADY